MIFLPSKAAALLPFLFLSALPAAAEPEQPRTAPNPTVPAHCIVRVEVSTAPFEVTEDSTLSLSGIQKLTNQSHHALTLQGQGLAVTRAVNRVNHFISYDAQSCPTWHVSTGWFRLEIFVARELNGNDCAHAHVLEHERHHVDIYRRALATLGERVQAKLEPRVESALRAADREAALRPLLESVLHEADTVMSEHNDFDSEEEYRRNETACDGAIRSIVRRRLWRAY